MTTAQSYSLLELTADIVSAFVSNNPARATDLPDLIATVHASLSTTGKVAAEVPPAPMPTPAVSIKKSVTEDHLICLEDGKKFKSLRRHLATAFNMTPEDYRAKWGLPRDYPMVAPGYAAKRSALAKATGLGNSRKAIPAPAPSEPAAANDIEPAVRKAAAKRAKGGDEIAVAAPAPAKRVGRPKKAKA